MNDKSEQSKEKLNGVFYTPNEIVDFLMDWAIDPNNSCSVLEPSAGNGSFANRVNEVCPNSVITAVEIDKEACAKIAKNENIIVYNEDFYNFYEDIKGKKQYDLVIGNPPYIRYQYLTSEQREYQSDILKRNGLKPNKLINAWVAFTVAGLELVKEGGKFAYVIPTDIFQVSYAKQLRSLLFNALDVVNVVTFSEIVFDNTQQDVAIIFGEKSSKSKKPMYRSFKAKDLSSLKGIKIDVDNVYEYTTNQDKWTEFKLDKEMRSLYKNNFVKNTVEFNKFAKVEVGVTTGRNQYFAVSQAIVDEYGLKKYSIPILGRSVETNGLFYTKEDLQTNSSSNKNTWLLDFNNKGLDEGALSYIKYGEDNDLNKGYKLSLRDKWYEVPSIWIPQAFILRRMGEYPKIVKNEINATSTDTFHRVKIFKEEEIYMVLVLFYSSISMLSIELESRVFGGGALEILPGDFKNIRIPKLNKDIDFKEIAQEVDKMLRDSVCVEDIVSLVDSKIRDYINFSNEELKLIYDNWIELKNKRMDK